MPKRASDSMRARRVETAVWSTGPEIGFICASDASSMRVIFRDDSELTN